MFLFFLIFFISCGAVIGSFTNCFIWRLHQNEGLMNRSYCPKCRQQIHWYDNIPILSFFVLRGKCRHCRKEISWQYPAVELSTALLFAGVFCLAAWNMATPEELYWAMGDWHFIARLARDLFIVFIFTVVFVYDLRWYLVLDKAVLPAAAILFGLNLYLDFVWWKVLLAAFLGASFFLAQFLISRGKWIGGGDIRLGLLIGAAFGRLDYLGLTLMLAYSIGSVVGITLVASKKKGWGSEVPLGVFLAIASLISLFFGDAIINWYLGLI